MILAVNGYKNGLIVMVDLLKKDTPAIVVSRYTLPRLVDRSATLPSLELCQMIIH